MRNQVYRSAKGVVVDFDKIQDNMSKPVQNSAKRRKVVRVSQPEMIGFIPAQHVEEVEIPVLTPLESATIAIVSEETSRPKSKRAKELIDALETEHS